MVRADDNTKKVSYGVSKDMRQGEIEEEREI